MDAIMGALVAVLLANADGRTGRMMAALLGARPDAGRVIALWFAAFVLLAAVSATGAQVAAGSFGVGVHNMVAAIALGSAAAALLVPRRAAIDTGTAAAFPPWRLLLHFVRLQLGDRNQFLIFALGALSGAALWGIVGGAAGLLVAMLPVIGLGPTLLDGKGGARARWIAAAALALWALLCLRRAFGV
jgi:Ca2+/H+ antiporter, TMEM165/GDT1 family